MKNLSNLAFSLIEVLIALAIFAVCAGYVSSAFSNAILAREKNSEINYTNLNIDLVRKQLLLEPSIEEAEKGGDVILINDQEASWEVEILPTEIVDLYECFLEIEILESKISEKEIYSEKFFLLRPTWTDPLDRSELLEYKKRELFDRREFE